MPLYLFYPRDKAGVALMFEAHEFVDDAAALRKASEILGEHGSASTIEAWCDERRVASVSLTDDRPSRPIFSLARIAAEGAGR